MRDFKKLVVWQKAHAFVLGAYRASAGFPADERFGLTIQLRKAASSIAANIAEGCGRSTDRDFARFLTMAAGSASESEYHLLLARDLGYLGAAPHVELDRSVTEVKKMLDSFRSRLPGLLTPDT